LSTALPSVARPELAEPASGRDHFQSTYRIREIWIPILLFYLIEWDAQSIGHTFTVCRIGFHAISDMADLNFFGCIAQCPGGIANNRAFFSGVIRRNKSLGWV